MMFRKLFKLLCFGPIVLACLLGVAWIFENFRGASQWTEAKERAAQMGVSLDLEDYQVAEIAEEDRLLNDPVFKAEWEEEIEPKLGKIRELKFPDVLTKGIKSGSKSEGRAFDFRQFFKAEMSEEEAVKILNQHMEPISERLEKLSSIILERPVQEIVSRSYLPSHLDKSTSAFRLLKFSSAFQADTRLAIRRGDSARALQNIRALARLRENCQGPNLINIIIGDALLPSHEIWDGIRLHLWNEKELQELAQIIPAESNLEALEEAIRYEAAFAVAQVDHALEIQKANAEMYPPEAEETATDHIRFWMNHKGPAGWQDWRRATVCKTSLDMLEMRPLWNEPWNEKFKVELPADDEEESEFHPLAAVRIYESGSFLFFRSFARGATRFRMMRLAIALEQYFLKKKAYPDTLESLELGFSIIDLNDPEQRPIQYERTDDGYFTIWLAAESETSTRPRERWRFSEAQN